MTTITHPPDIPPDRNAGPLEALASEIAAMREQTARLGEVVTILRQLTWPVAEIDAAAREDERALIFAGKRPRCRPHREGRADLHLVTAASVAAILEASR